MRKSISKITNGSNGHQPKENNTHAWEQIYKEKFHVQWISSMYTIG